jgi:queuine/archaeosine tRNA-ribosyltransferase
VILLQIKKDNDRGFTIETSTKKIKTPFFFPAISSVKTNGEVYEYLELIKKVGHSGFLISSYDIFAHKKREALSKDLSQMTSGATFTILDSGNYESFWKEDKTWTIEKFQSVLKDVSADICFSFDIFWSGKESIEKYIEDTIANTAITSSVQGYGETVPIVHGTPELLPKLVYGVIEGIRPKIIGVAERDLGSGLLERASTIKSIRIALDKVQPDTPLHILGTGNPISILVYTLCGADMFDGLEWCKNIVDPSNGHLYHFTQRDLFECECKACKTGNTSYQLKSTMHNLIFYENFTSEIRKAIEENQIERLMDKYLPKNIHKKLMEIAGSK